MQLAAQREAKASRILVDKANSRAVVLPWSASQNYPSMAKNPKYLFFYHKVLLFRMSFA